MLPLDAYLLERGRRCDRPAMYQRWRDLLFLHYSVDPAAMQCLVPEPLHVDTFPDANGVEKAWVGLVPFRMEGVRPRRLPSLPGHGAFPETNVRTYVHLNGRPAVWFFSLDAASATACRVARRFFHLPYREATMSVARTGGKIVYRSKRGANGPGVEIEAHVSGLPHVAELGSLEFFLLERYLLLATNGNDWFAGNVHHAPYQVRTVEIVSCLDSLVGAAGLSAQPFTHQMFSEGVDVNIGRLQRIDI